jgi:hypothetical protein
MNTETTNNDYRFYQPVSTLYGDSYIVQLMDGIELTLNKEEFANFQESLNKGHMCESGLVDPEDVTCNSPECNYDCPKHN